MKQRKTKIKKRDKARAHAWLDSAIDALKDGRTYEITIKEARRRRSLNANAYAWALINDIAAEVNLPPNYIYWRAVREIGGNSIMTSVKEEAADALEKTWSSRGLGWQAVKESEWRGYCNYRLIYGSSAYDTKQMSRLIDNLQQEAQNCGVETLAEKEIREMLENWDS